MKLFTALILIASVAFAQQGGQRALQSGIVTWSAASGSWLSKTRLLFLGNNVYVDISSSGQDNTFQRIDNTVDSCSNPQFITGETDGSIYPTWLSGLLWAVVRAKDGDSSAHVFRIQSRLRFYDDTRRNVIYTPWTNSGTSFGTGDVTVDDLVHFQNAFTTSKLSQYGISSIFGTEVRFCPDDVPETANQATDSIFSDSLRFITR